MWASWGKGCGMVQGSVGTAMMGERLWMRHHGWSSREGH